MVATTQPAAGAPAQPTLTPFEQQVLDRLAAIERRLGPEVSPHKGTATRKAAADFLGCSPWTVDRMVMRNALKKVEGFRAPRFAWSDLEKLRAGNPAVTKKR